MAQTDFTLPICEKMRELTCGWGDEKVDSNTQTLTEATDTIDEAVRLLEAFLKQHVGGSDGRKGLCCWEADAAIDFLAKARGEVTP